MDQEKLYEEALFLKKQINYMKEENTKLKTRILALEKQMKKSPTISDDNVIQLQQNVRAMRSMIRSKDEELNKVRRSLKFTHQQEIETVNQSYIDENKRLRHMLEDVMHRQQEGQSKPIFSQKLDKGTQLKHLTKQNQELLEVLGNNQRENQLMRTKLMELETKVAISNKSKFKEELNQLKQVNQSLLQSIYDKEGKIKQLEDHMAKNEKQRAGEEIPLNQKIMEQTVEISKKSQIIDELLKGNSTLDIAFNDLQNQYNILQEQYQTLYQQNQKDQLENQGILLELMQLQKYKSNFLNKSESIKKALQSISSLKENLAIEKSQFQEYVVFLEENINDFNNKYCN